MADTPLKTSTKIWNVKYPVEYQKSPVASFFISTTSRLARIKLDPDYWTLVQPGSRGGVFGAHEWGFGAHKWGFRRTMNFLYFCILHLLDFFYFLNEIVGAEKVPLGP